MYIERIEIIIIREVTINILNRGTYNVHVLTAANGTKSQANARNMKGEYYFKVRPE